MGRRSGSVGNPSRRRKAIGSNRPPLILRDLEVQLPVMTDDHKVVPFPPPASSPEPDPIAKRHQRVILSIGSQRLAFDFYHQVTKLNPAPAPVIPVDRSKPRRVRKPRK